MAEQRCTDLGSGCVCSEPMQATSYPESANDFKNPNDTSSLECSNDGVTGGAIVRTADDVVADTDATAMAALPAGHSVARFMRGPDGHTGTFYVGQGDAVSSSLVRVAARFYKYHSPGFEFNGDGVCFNSKFIQGNSWNTDMDVGNNIHLLNTSGLWTPDVDCCTSGPGGGGIDFADLRGKWWRFEAVMTSRAGPDFRLIIYAKNVTDNQAEYVLLDTNSAPVCSGLNCRPQTPNAGLLSNITINGHRAATCGGWMGVLYYMYGGWTTNDGQRIGAASEIEGGEPVQTRNSFLMLG